MNETKPFYQSVTFWGVIMSVVGKLVAGWLGIDWQEGDVNFWAGSFAAAGSFVGDALAWYGRKRATTKIG